MLQIKGFDFLLTFKCTAACQHCSYKAGPDKTGYITKDDIKRYLTELSDTQSLHSITIHGGEPFIYFDQLKFVLEKAKELNISQRGVITNSFWAKTEEIALKKLIQLKDAGLTRITFSADGFHQEFVSLLNVKNAIQSAVEIGIEKIWVDSYYLGGYNFANPYNKSTKKIIEDLKGIFTVEFNQYIASFEGRGANLTKSVKLRSYLPSGKCPLPFWIGGDLQSPTTVEIDYQGNVTLCPGISIGNTRNQSLIDIIQNYNCDKHPILSLIADEGPKGILKLARKHGFTEDLFYNECHLCYSTRKFLVPFYPQYLAPTTCY
ncbi:MAG: radical SAM/SPASM domain-containing protein [Candidatus Hodarchaeota archaeon]